MGVGAHFLFHHNGQEREEGTHGQEVAMSTDERGLRALVDDLAAPDGLDILEVAVKGQGPRKLVRVVVDRKGGVDVGTCQRLSGRLSSRLDDVDLVDGPFTLEVTSPGTSYPLEGRRAFDRVEGRPVRVLRDGAAELRGIVTAAEEDGVVLDVDGESVRVPYADITKATQALPW